MLANGSILKFLAKLGTNSTKAAVQSLTVDLPQVDLMTFRVPYGLKFSQNFDFSSFVRTNFCEIGFQTLLIGIIICAFLYGTVDDPFL